MSNEPIQLIVATFQDEKTAKEAFKNLNQIQKEKLIKIENAAVLSKDEQGKLHIKETASIGTAKGAKLGGVAGAVVGLIAGPALLVPAAVGALVGGLTARLRDAGFSDARLEALGDSLNPGSSAIVAIVERTWEIEVKEALNQAGADLLTASISVGISQQLEAGHDVAYSAISSQQGFSASRLADDAEGGQVTIDDSALYGARFVATKDGFAVMPLEPADEV